MASFSYIARNATGQEVSGQMLADSEASVLRALEDKRLLPVHVEERVVRAVSLRGQVPGRALGVFYGQLADLLRAGVPLLRALETLERALTNRRLAQETAVVREKVASGETLADAMMERSEVFAPLHCAMVRAGERAGFLEDVLANLATFLERQDELRSKVRGALIYPLVLTVIGGVMMVVVLTVLVPRFKGFFARIDLPLPTRMLFAASDVLSQHLWVLLGLAVAAVFLVRAAVRSPVGRRTWDRWKLSMPLVGRPVRMVAITRFCRILGTMLANGVPILQSLAISKDAAGNVMLADSIASAAENVRAGEPLAAPLKAGGLFPPEILEMIAVAEESNQLDKVLVQIADTVERRTNRQVDAAVRLIEPLILVVVAGIIGFMAVGLMYPIFTMSQTLR